MTRRLFIFAALLLAQALEAQPRSLLPATRADTLLQAGRWNDAESAFYAQSERSPRDPIARAALGRYLAMKGALRIGIVLIDEARQFGLDPAIARDLVGPLRTIVNWRSSAASMKRDSTLAIRAASSPDALFQLRLDRGLVRSASGPLRAQDATWQDVVDRPIGIDSVGARTHSVGVEVFEAFSPAVDVRENTVTFHADPRAALTSTGPRYAVLRSREGVRVLMSEGRVLPLTVALRQLRPTWWQLDLVHGFLVVR